MKTFAELGLAEPILRALQSEGYTAPTPIQAEAIPPLIAGKDLLGIAQTGTGKTAAFALPILTRLAADTKPLPRRGCRALVLSPTRELASQIAESFRVYGHHLGLSVAVVFGGVAMRPQITTLARGVDVLVATPGRLLDHIGERTLTLASTEILVLDEADQMLDLGFVKPVRRIAAQLSMNRQTLMFSATMPKEIAALAGELLNDPVQVAVAPVATTAERVEQRVILIEASRKREALAELLADPEMTRTLVFTRTKRGADRVAKHLSDVNVPAIAIHGNKSQRQREEALYGFRRGKTRVLVATDIAARGIDIDAVSHVINYEMPEVPEAYVHRIGRTARAGASGLAISLVAPDERDKLRAIEKLTRQTIPAENKQGQYTTGEGEPAEVRRERSQQRGGRPGQGRTGGDRGDRGGSRAGGGRSGDREGRGPGRSADRGGDRGGDRPWSNSAPRNGGGGERRRPDGDDTRGERPWSNRPPRSNDGGDRVARDGGGHGDRPRSDRPAGAPRSADRPHRDRPHGDRPHSDRPNGDRPHRDRSTGDSAPHASGKRFGERSGSNGERRDTRPRDGARADGGGRPSQPRSNDAKPWQGRREGRPAGGPTGERGADRGGYRGSDQSRPRDGARNGERGEDRRPGGQPNGHAGGKPWGRPAGRTGGAPGGGSGARPHGGDKPRGKPADARPHGDRPNGATGQKRPGFKRGPGADRPHSRGAKPAAE